MSGMSLVGIDSNILIYAISRPKSEADREFSPSCGGVSGRSGMSSAVFAHTTWLLAGCEKSNYATLRNPKNPRFPRVLHPKNNFQKKCVEYIALVDIVCIITDVGTSDTNLNTRGNKMSRDEIQQLGYRDAAIAKPQKVTISRDGVWAGDGRWTEDCEIVDCPAVLGQDQDASDETYELLCDALASLDGNGTVSVERPDGIYTAELA